MPCCNKDPISSEVHTWKVVINVLRSLLKNTPTGKLVIVYLTDLSVVKICPEWSNNVCDPT